MRYRPHIYAQALREVLRAEPPERHTKLLGHFTSLVRRNGDGSYLDQIALELEGLLVREAGGKVVTLEFARPPQSELLSQVTALFTEQDQITVKLRPELSAGVRITVDGERELDNSLARKLRLMFNN